MLIAASWFGIRSDRIQVRGAMICADYGKLPLGIPNHRLYKSLQTNKIHHYQAEPGIESGLTGRPPQVVADGGEHGVGGVAVGPSEEVAAHAVLALGVADNERRRRSRFGRVLIVLSAFDRSSRAEEGTGLVLQIARGNVELHGAGVESPAGQRDASASERGRGRR
jgi:hypothetical protein